MGLRDLSETWGWIQRIVRRLERIESGAILERSSITDGVMTFIRGTLRLLNGARLELEGILDIVGQVFLKGPMTVSGPNAAITVGGVVITPLGGGRVQIGPNITLDAAEQRLTIGTGDAQIILDLTQFKVGPAFRMDPAHSDTGAQQEFGTNGRTTMYGEDAYAQLTKLDSSGSAVAWVRVGTVNDFTGVQLRGDVSAPNIALKPSGVPSMYLVLGDDGVIYKVSAGGPGPGDPGDPPSGNPEGYIWPVDPAVYGIGDDFQAHINRGSLEPGVDIPCGPGTPVWAPGDGAIVDVSNSVESNMGRYVTLVTDSGDWFRFLHLSGTAVSVGDTVTQTQLLGYSGGSGRGSESGYGPHLHLSFKVGYTGVFPGGAALDDFQAYMLAA